MATTKEMLKFNLLAMEARLAAKVLDEDADELEAQARKLRARAQILRDAADK